MQLKVKENILMKRERGEIFNVRWSEERASTEGGIMKTQEGGKEEEIISN